MTKQDAQDGVSIMAKKYGCSRWMALARLKQIVRQRRRSCNPAERTTSRTLELALRLLK